MGRGDDREGGVGMVGVFRMGWLSMGGCWGVGEYEGDVDGVRVWGWG